MDGPFAGYTPILRYGSAVRPATLPGLKRGQLARHSPPASACIKSAPSRRIFFKSQAPAKRSPNLAGEPPAPSAATLSRKSCQNENGPDCSRPFSCQLSFRTLEVDFHSQLLDARIARRCHLVLEGGNKACRGAANWIGVVERIEGFKTQLASEALSKLHVLEQREIGAPKARAAAGARTLACFRCLRGRRRSKRGRNRLHQPAGKLFS